MKNEFELFGAGDKVILTFGGLQLTLPCSLRELEDMCIEEQRRQDASEVIGKRVSETGHYQHLKEAV